MADTSSHSGAVGVNPPSQEVPLPQRGWRVYRTLALGGQDVTVMVVPAIVPLVIERLVPIASVRMIKEPTGGSLSPPVPDPEDVAGLQSLRDRDMVVNLLQCAVAIDHRTEDGRRFRLDCTREEASRKDAPIGASNFVWAQRAAEELIARFTEVELAELMTIQAASVLIRGGTSLGK